MGQMGTWGMQNITNILRISVYVGPPGKERMLTGALIVIGRFPMQNVMAFTFPMWYVTLRVPWTMTILRRRRAATERGNAHFGVEAASMRQIAQFIFI